MLDFVGDCLCGGGGKPGDRHVAPARIVLARSALRGCSATVVTLSNRHKYRPLQWVRVASIRAKSEVIMRCVPVVVVSA